MLRVTKAVVHLLGELPHPYKVIIPGNHEFVLEENPGMRHEITNAVMLIDEGIEIAGLRIWGSPMTPLYGGAFGRSSTEDRARVYDSIPEGTDILITHSPPFGILDCATGSKKYQGCRELLRAVTRLKPRLHVFGHIHGAYGTFPTEHTLFVNAALCDEAGELAEQPIVLEFLP